MEIPSSDTCVGQKGLWGEMSPAHPAAWVCKWKWDRAELILEGISFRSYLNGLVVFPTFYNLSLNFSIRSLLSEPQSAPSLVFTDCVLYRASSALAAKNIINLISLLAIW